MTIESTNNNIPTTPAITYSECYQQCFCSDNLELMKTIESNSIDLIYCDILYGTGRKFKDYQDLKPIRSEIEAHYLPRLKEMHRVLKSTGSIYLQMDTRINHWMRCIMDDVFGYDKFLNEISWCYTGASNNKKTYPKKHDVILFYGNKLIEPQRILYKSGIHNKGNYFKKEGSKNECRVNELENIGKMVEDWWVDIYPINPANKERNYDTKKPKSLIERIIKASSNEGDLVADFYLGSGTTAEVCKDLNRNFIGCDINPRAVEITLKRLNNARS